jgi:ATP-binding cassette subfamily F protein 3
VLSGGEKARLALAKLFLRPANFLVLDEPTNHLDVDACEVLEDAIGAYAGTVLLVSHDRALVNAVATRVVEVRAGKLRDFRGNYDGYLKTVAEEAAGPGSSPRVAEPDPGPIDAGPIDVAGYHRSSRERRRAAERNVRELAKLEASIAEHEDALAQTEAQMAEPAAYRDGARMRELEAERAALRAELDAFYERWTALADDGAESA